MINIKISRLLKDINPLMVLGVIECNVTNSEFNQFLWDEIARITLDVRSNWSFEAIKDQPRIAATRAMYSTCGKEPSRYRPSAEALMRRIVKGQDLYQINTLVDLINLVSLKSGYSIGGFNASFIKGNLEAGIGKSAEPYNAIGRGLLNIENLPVLRDLAGPIGTPTSDEERTAIRLNTNHLLMVINAYDGENGLPETMEYALKLLKTSANASVINFEIIH